jgi:hypothetical protein
MMVADLDPKRFVKLNPNFKKIVFGSTTLLLFSFERGIYGI